MFAKSKPIIFLLAAAALVLSAYGVMVAQARGSGGALAAPQAQTTQPATRTLSVSGSGQVQLAPDIAYVTIGVHTQDVDAQVAVDENTAQVEALIDALVASGVARADLQTTNFNIYSWEDYSLPVDSESQKPPIVYSVDNSVYVTVRDLDGLGDLLSTAIDAGANNIWGIQFDVTDKSEATSQAREAAVAAARAQAEELAGFAGVELGQIVSISSYGGGYPIPFAQGMGGSGVAAEAAASVPVSPGQITVSVEVSIVFEIE
ncbi:MAG TPA: SIMPL domain-containing protein [Anaerolineales bacterium]|nr:SIMPL domain-containing protein [Anaerolineales bacterium]